MGKFASVCILVFCGAAMSAAQSLSVPHSEGFDSGTSLPVGWSSSQNRTTGTNDFVVSNSSARSAPNAALSTNSTVAQWLASPSFDFLRRFPDRLTFFTRRSSTHTARLVVDMSLDGGGSWSITLPDTFTNIGSTGYVQSSCAIPPTAFGCSSVRFRWRTLPDAGGTTGTLRIDDIFVSALLPEDLRLSSLRVDPPFPVEGEAMHIRAVVANAGSLPASLAAVDFFLGSPGIFLKSMPLPLPLAPGDSTMLAFSMTAPEGGPTSVTARVAWPADGDSSNNIIALAIDIGYARGSVLVNEIMYAPASPEPEWIEVFNPRVGPVSLRNWLLSDASTSTRHSISQQDLKLEGGSFAVLTKDSLAMLETYAGLRGTLITVNGFPSLNNGGDAVVLYSPDGRVIDSVVYAPGWGGSTGCSLERLDVFAPSCDSANWCSSTDSLHATPCRNNSTIKMDVDLAIQSVHALPLHGNSPLALDVVIVNRGRTAPPAYQAALLRNDTILDQIDLRTPLAPGDSLRATLSWSRPVSGLHELRVLVQCQGDGRISNNERVCPVVIPFPVAALSINEIMFAPSPGCGEYVELVNVSADSINMRGWKLSDSPTAGGTTNEFVIAESTLVLPPAGYLVICSDSSVSKHFPEVGKNSLAVYGNASTLGLNNDGDAVILRDASGTMVDSVSYSAGWHNPSLQDCTGRSLEKIRPQLAPNDPRSWSSCVAGGGGTPGKENSIYVSMPPVSTRLGCSPNPFSPDGDGVDDFTTVHYELPGQVFMMNITVFDVRGRPIRHLARNEPAGPSGEIVWGGRDDAAMRARIGMYVVFLEAVDQLTGAVITAKRVVVLAGIL